MLVGTLDRLWSRRGIPIADIAGRHSHRGPGLAQFGLVAPALLVGLAITLAVFAFNLFGDSLRDYLDPRFKT